MNKYYRLFKLFKKEKIISVKDYYKQKMSEENKIYLYCQKKFIERNMKEML